MIEVLAQRRPFDRVFDIGLALDHLLLHRAIERPHGFAFAHDFERDALANIALRLAILEECFSRPTEQVDESRRDREPFGVDFHFATRVGQLANRRDAVTIDRDVPDEWRVPAAVVNHAVPKDDIVICTK